MSGFARRLLGAFNLSMRLSMRLSMNLLIGALCFAPALHAAEPVSQTPPLDPKVYDLDSRHGVLVVYQRMQTIAEHHCVASSELAQALSTKEQACRERVLAQLLGKLADPYLSYLHENPEAQRLAKR
jgi:UrcA family protein